MSQFVSQNTLYQLQNVLKDYYTALKLFGKFNDYFKLFVYYLDINIHIKMQNEE